MEYLVKLLAPQSRIGFLLKLIGVLAAIMACFFIQKLIFVGWQPEKLPDDFRALTLIGVPFIALGLSLIGHLERLQSKLATLAATDMLTGLPNRRAFLEAVQAQRDDPASDVLMMIDIDHFKRINDTFGHAVGDLCLQRLADCFRGLIREEDIVARIGGEEFAVLLQKASLEEALPIARRIAGGKRIDLENDKGDIRVTTSIGLAVLQADASIDEILHKADEALYRAKAEGRACFRIAAQDNDSRTVA